MKSASFTAINNRILGLDRLSSKATAWHLCKVIVPRRTITGRLRSGKFGAVTAVGIGCIKSSSGDSK